MLPGLRTGVLEILAARKPLRVVRMGGSLTEPADDNGLEVKRVAGGLLIQKRFDSKIVSPADIDVVSKRRPTDDEIQAALLAWNVAAFTRCNAVVIGTKDRIHGIGSGQRSRIDSTEDAIRISRRGYGPEGCVLASDAFMPFPDVVELAGKTGLTAIIYPLGLGQGPGSHRPGGRTRLGHDRHPETGRDRLRTLFPPPLRRIGPEAGASCKDRTWV